ncbi:GntR family transcriptional regulator [Phyllobacterium endophyticum]|uniref:GntR family transcriptional regulator n=1 Tax=Phyllobacterium endophyticum TaxID=1149773 RepID=UPI0011CCAF74|nr:GntR family transcriptional regulator [Phyllobacterium endophyticum]TXR48769.1 GntR family transcriptional regulator [Phyllobacterium endophyticum]
MEREQLFVEVLSRIGAYEPGIPLHKKLKMALQELIVSNRIRRGATLPGERTMAEALSLSRVTVRKAIELLIEDGHLRRRHGAKTEVSVPVEKSLSTLASFSEDMIARGLEPGCIWVSKEIGRPSPAEAMALALPPNAQIIRLKRIRTADGNPAAYETAVVPARFLPSPDLVSNSLYEALAKRNVLPQRAIQRLRSRPASAQDSELLKCTVGSPLIIIERRCFLPDDQPVEFTETRYRGDLYDFVTELSR